MRNSAQRFLGAWIALFIAYSPAWGFNTEYRAACVITPVSAAPLRTDCEVVSSMSQGSYGATVKLLNGTEYQIEGDLARPEDWKVNGDDAVIVDPQSMSRSCYRTAKLEICIKEIENLSTIKPKPAEIGDRLQTTGEAVVCASPEVVKAARKKLEDKEVLAALHCVHAEMGLHVILLDPQTSPDGSIMKISITSLEGKTMTAYTDPSSLLGGDIYELLRKVQKGR